MLVPVYLCYCVLRCRASDTKRTNNTRRAAAVRSYCWRYSSDDHRRVSQPVCFQFRLLRSASRHLWHAQVGIPTIFLNYHLHFHSQKSQKSLTSLCIASSLESASCLIPSTVHKPLLIMSHSLIYIPPAHHSHPLSHIHCFISGPKSQLSRNLFHHSLLALNLDCLLGLCWTGLILLSSFHF